MSADAALMYMHSMIISHITYCLTTWSQASITTLKPLEFLYKQSLKTLDKKSVQFHHCSILKKYNLLSWDNLIKYVHICLLFKTMHSLSSPLKQFVNIRTTAHRSTRGGERGDCIIPFKRSNFSQSVFSVKAAREWNSIPSTIRRLHTFGSFQSHLNKMVTDNSALSTLVLYSYNRHPCTNCSWLCCSLLLPSFSFSLSFSHVYFVLDNSLIFCILVAIFLIVCDFWFL